jgi:hypothetical protein
LFQEGRRLMAEQRYAEACERFEQSLGLTQGVGIEYNLADCWERLGRAASAQAMFAKAAATARAAGRLDREEAALRRSAALEPRLARLAIEVKDGAQEVAVRRNREPVAFEALGQPLPIDPGMYDIEVSAPGKVSWTKSVRVPPGAVVWITVPPLEAAIPPSAPVDAASKADSLEDEAPSNAGDGTSNAEQTPDPTPVAKSSMPHAATIGLLTLGVGGVATGTAFALKYRSSSDAAGNVCPAVSATCTPDDLDRYDELADDAKAARTGAFIGFGIGGAALVGAAITHWALGLRPEQAQSGFIPQPVVGPGGSWGLVSRGRF